MIALWILLGLETALLIWLAIDKTKHTSGGALTSEHALVKVYYQRSDYSMSRGWAWKCSCGGGALIDSYSNPTEARALSAWKAHKGLYAQLAVDTGEDKYKVLYEDKRAELEKFQKACYCKDIH